MVKPGKPQEDSMRREKRKHDSKKIIRTFAAASFLNDLGSDMIYPIWPIFVTTVMGANMAVLGFIDGLGEALVSISQAISGYISDRIQKRKIFIWIGYLFGSLSRVGYAISTYWPGLIPFRIMDRAGKIRSAPRDAIIADESMRADRGKNFGFLRTMDNLGAVCGIVICILFFKILGYRTLFFLAALPSVIGAILILKVIREKKNSGIRIYQGFSFRKLDINFRLFLLLSAMFALGAFSYSFLLIYAKESGFRPTFVPLLYLIFTVVASAFSLPFGKLADRIGRKPVLFFSFFCWALVCLGIIFIRGKLVILMIFMLYGLHKGALEPVQKTMVAELSPRDYRASTLGGFQMVIGLCALPASLIAGLLWDRLGIITPFLCSLILTVLASVLLLFVREKQDG